nr:hypothetical protein [Tanacetum cinerariifolium]
MRRSARNCHSSTLHRYKAKYETNPPLQICKSSYEDAEQEKIQNRFALKTLLQQNPKSYKQESNKRRWELAMSRTRPTAWKRYTVTDLTLDGVFINKKQNEGTSNAQEENKGTPLPNPAATDQTTEKQHAYQEGKGKLAKRPLFPTTSTDPKKQT